MPLGQFPLARRAATVRWSASARRRYNGPVQIGDWSATKDLNDIYGQIRDLGLETNLAELEAFGFTVIEDALSPGLTKELREAVIIHRRGARDVALVAADELESLMETAHLLRSPKNAKRLIAALQRARRRRLKPQAIHKLRRDFGLAKEA